MQDKIKLLQAIAVMIGYIIGVGMFGLPFVVARAGVWPFLFFILLFGAIQYFQHLAYANIVVATDSYHQLPGYAGVYLGHVGKKILAIVKMGGNYGALLAYIIISGIFLNELLSPTFGGNEFFYSSLVFAVCALVVFSGLKMIAKSELIMSALLVAVVIFIAYRGAGSVDAVNFISADWAYFFLPFGATLMALDGNGSIPAVVKILGKDPRAIKKAVTIGTFVSILITMAFTFIVVGISGADTTPDALVGLKKVLHNGVILFSLLFGVLSITTSIILVAEEGRETFAWDFKINKHVALALVLSVPYLLFVCGFNDLTEVISLAGGLAGGLSAIMLILIFNQLKKIPGKLVLFKWNPPSYLLFIITMMFMTGIFFELGHFILGF